MKRKLVTYIPIAVLAVGLLIGFFQMFVPSPWDDNQVQAASVQQDAIGDSVQVAYLGSANDPGGGAPSAPATITVTITPIDGTTLGVAMVLDPGGGVQTISISMDSPASTVTNDTATHAVTLAYLSYGEEGSGPARQHPLIFPIASQSERVTVKFENGNLNSINGASGQMASVTIAGHTEPVSLQSSCSQANINGLQLSGVLPVARTDLTRSALVRVSGNSNFV